MRRAAVGETPARLGRVRLLRRAGGLGSELQQHSEPDGHKGGGGDDGGRATRDLRLVEKAAALEQLSALLGGDLDVRRRQQEDLVGDPLHTSVEGVRQSAREVDQAL